MTLDTLYPLKDLRKIYLNSCHDDDTTLVRFTKNEEKGACLSHHLRNINEQHPFFVIKLDIMLKIM